MTIYEKFYQIDTTTETAKREFKKSLRILAATCKEDPPITTQGPSYTYIIKENKYDKT